jgi:hypothetical protein
MFTIDLPALVLAVSFFFYGSRCLFSEAMSREFRRWGVSHLRYLTGILEVLGSLGLVVGLWIPWVGFLAATGLSLLMLCGVAVRIRIKDTLLQTLPAVLFLFLSVFVMWRHFLLFQ